MVGRVQLRDEGLDVVQENLPGEMTGFRAYTAGVNSFIDMKGFENDATCSPSEFTSGV